MTTATVTATAQPNRRKENKARTRAKILAAATRLLVKHEGDFGPVTMRNVAAEAGLSTGAVFANWSGKEELLLDACRADPDGAGAWAVTFAHQRASDITAALQKAA